MRVRVCELFRKGASSHCYCDCARGNNPPTPQHSLAKIFFFLAPLFQSSQHLLHEMILSAQSNWQLRSLSSTQLRLSLFTASSQKGCFRIPPSAFITPAVAKQRDERWAGYPTYSGGRSHFEELSLHSHARCICIRVKWLITVLHDNPGQLCY